MTTRKTVKWSNLFVLGNRHASPREAGGAPEVSSGSAADPDQNQLPAGGLSHRILPTCEGQSPVSTLGVLSGPTFPGTLLSSQHFRLQQLRKDKPSFVFVLVFVPALGMNKPDSMGHTHHTHPVFRVVHR